MVWLKKFQNNLQKILLKNFVEGISFEYLVYYLVKGEKKKQESCDYLKQQQLICFPPGR